MEVGSVKFGSMNQPGCRPIRCKVSETATRLNHIAPLIESNNRSGKTRFASIGGTPKEKASLLIKSIMQTATSATVQRGTLTVAPVMLVAEEGVPVGRSAGEASSVADGGGGGGRRELISRCTSAANTERSQPRSTTTAAGKGASTMAVAQADMRHLATASRSKSE